MHRFVTQRLIQDHANIGRVLALMSIQLRFLDADETSGLALLSAAANYLIHYPGLLHHPLEELMFDAVAAGSPSAAGLHTRLKQEHAQLTTSATDLVARIGLQQLSREPQVSGLQRTGAEYILAYDDHIRFEEQEIFPMALDVLKAEQWQGIRDTLVLDGDPLFGRESRTLYDNLYDVLMHQGEHIAGKPKD